MLPEGLHFGVTVFLGLCFGSLATALSWRLPRGVNVAVERSRCPTCHHALGVPDLVPILSWLALRGRCRFCKAPIGWRYPLIEFATLALCLAFYARFGFSESTLLLFCLAPVVVAAADIDFAFKILPDSLNLAVLLIGGAVLGANSLLSSDPPGFITDHLEDGAGGMILYAGTSLLLRYACMAVLKKDPLGMGDVKLFAASGFWFGLNFEAFGYFLVLSGMMSICIGLMWRKFHTEPEYPFGPALLAALVTILLWVPPSFIFQ
jgi:leader peptidase (prepilin peptidase)/N-methyltransferase